MYKLFILMFLISCGKQGSDGHDGFNGKDGKDGANGQDASIEVVKFCPNLTDSYGVQYSEVGFCIDGKVFAVYSTKKESFMTELSNGRYTTTTPFGNCTFHVDDNCTITME